MTRPLHARTPALALVALATLAAPRAFAAWPSNGAVNLPVALAPGSKGGHAVASDLAGGFYVAWRDDRNVATGNDVYLQRISAAGAVAPGWTANGNLICNAADLQIPDAAAPDAAGGVYVAWRDRRAGNYDIYLQHVSASGALVAGWPANGLAVSTRPDEEGSIQLLPDGAGGVYLVWGIATSGASGQDLYGVRVQSNGTPASGWPSNGKALVATSAEEFDPSAAVGSDGRLDVAYVSSSAGNDDVRLAYFSAAGASAGGFIVCAATGTQSNPVLVPNGAGGALVFWDDQRSGLPAAYGLMLLADGTRPAGWPVNGLMLVPEPASLRDAVTDDHAGAWLLATITGGDGSGQLLHVRSTGASTTVADGSFFGSNTSGSLLPDGRGGVIAGWAGTPAGFGSDVYAGRFNYDGSAARGWTDTRTLGPVVVCSAAGDQNSVELATDGANGVLLAWNDPRTVSTNEIYAQRVERFGRLGNPEPAIAGVKDVKNDQGGFVRVSWNASYLDVEPQFPVAIYRVWRQVPAALALARLARGEARLLEARDETPASSEARRARTLRATTTDGVQTFWEPAGEVTASGLPSYSFTAVTAGDSTAAGAPTTAFFVDAVAFDASFWSSAADSGYSVDNLAPLAPAAFAGVFAPGTGVSLFWNANGESDLAGYRLYAGHDPGFLPDAAHLVAAPSSPGWFGPDALPAYYKLTAVDVHGNESRFAFLLPAGTLDAAAEPAPGEFALAAPSPNPARSGPVAFAFALPRAGVVRLALYDVQGRPRRTLVAGAREAGEHRETWDGRDDRGARLPAGAYFARLELEGRALVRRLVWLP